MWCRVGAESDRHGGAALHAHPLEHLLQCLRTADTNRLPGVSAMTRPNKETS